MNVTTRPLEPRTGPLGVHVPRRAVLDALSAALGQADHEARERLSGWLGMVRVLTWTEIEAETERLQSFEALERHRADMREAFLRRYPGERAARRVATLPPESESTEALLEDTVWVDGERLG